jgi:hypothetical protein
MSLRDPVSSRSVLLRRVAGAATPVRFWSVLSGSLLNEARVMLQQAGGGVLMTQRLACPPAPSSLEEFAGAFDSVLATLAQRRGFRD